MIISFLPIDEPAVYAIVRWRYEPPYDLYNLKESEASIQYALDPQYNYYAMRDENGELVGFCTFGVDGQVPGGDYTTDALDIGMGIHPDYTGQGLGRDFVIAVLDFAKKEFQPTAFRVTIAAFNQRAQRVWMKNGFQPSQTFSHQANKREFIVMIRDANSNPGSQDFRQ